MCLVKEIHEQIEQTEALKKDLEEQYPSLTAMDIPLSNPVARTASRGLD